MEYREQDRSELKSQALLETVARLTTNYENQIADLRVQATMQAQQINALNAENERLRNEVQEEENSDPTD